MKSTSVLTRKERKALRALRKARWKAELPDYYINVTRTSAAGIEYVVLKRTRVVPRYRIV